MAGWQIIWDKHMRKFFRSKFELIASLAVPLLLMVLFGAAMRNVVAVGAVGGLDYLAYITPGIMAFTALTAAILGGATLLTERMNGVVRTYLVAPIPRLSILLAAIASGLSKAALQSAIILVVAVAFGVRLAGGPVGLLASLLALLAFGLGFSALTVAAAARAPSMESYHSSITLLNIPLLFASSALYPLGAMPGWLRAVSLVNPTTYLIEAMQFGLFGRASRLGPAVDFAVLAGFAGLALALAHRAFRNVTD